MRTERLQSIDRLRGLVLILMALDHCRGFVAPPGQSPENLDTTTLPFFAMRWFTHLCAPAFLLLAGAAARLWSERRSTEEHGAHAVQAWLVKRGLWLMFLEITWVNFSWFFAFQQLHLGVLWAIGGAMILLAGALALRMSSQGLLVLSLAGTLAIALFPPAKGGLFSFLVLPSYHEPTWLGGMPLMNVYVVLPWFFVLALGWSIAPLLRDRLRTSALIGLGMCLAFVFLRLANGIGDPTPWGVHERGPLVTAMSFLNPSKYPPSLMFVLMTLGPALALLLPLSQLRGAAGRVLSTLGRVPLFFYLLHIPAYHATALVLSWLRFGSPKPPEDAALSLSWILLQWLVVLGLLWPICRRWAEVKTRRREFWVRYL